MGELGCWPTFLRAQVNSTTAKLVSECSGKASYAAFEPGVVASLE